MQPAYATKLAARLTTAVTTRLGAPVTFSHWVKRSTGDIPAFVVPVSHLQAARALGLMVRAA